MALMSMYETDIDKYVCESLYSLDLSASASQE